jgi:metal-responsive CopG/Arc/MetJ family transcriptional regulator
LTFLHTHVEEGYCIEITVAKGDAQIMKAFIAALKANKQISEVKVTLLEDGIISNLKGLNKLSNLILKHVH